MGNDAAIALVLVAGTVLCSSCSLSSIVAAKNKTAPSKGSPQGVVSAAVSAVADVVASTAKDAGSAVAGGVKNAAKTTKTAVESASKKTTSDLKKISADAKAKKATPAPTTAPPPSKGGAVGYSFDSGAALAALNALRATDGAKPLVIDPTLMAGAQARANQGSFPHDTNDYQKAGASECLSLECSGSGDDVIKWSLAKLYTFEKEGKQNATAPGSSCYAVIPSDQGHYKILSDKTGTHTKLGIGLAKPKTFSGGPVPSHMNALVTWWLV